MERREVREGLQVSAGLGAMIETEALPVSGVEPARFWQGLSALLHEFAPKNRALLARREELQAPLRERIRGNLSTLRTLLPPGSPASLLEPEGGWSAVLRVPATLSEEERVARLLRERDVHAHPGYFFDFPREAYLVLSLLPDPRVFAEAMERIAADVVL